MITISAILVWGTYIFFLYFMVFWLLVYIEEPKEKKVIKLDFFPKVSIIIPAWNEENSIKKTIDSALNLDYPKDKLEIIIINDGSTDQTQKIVEKIIQNNLDKDLKLINQKNQGKGKSLNNALKIAKGEFFIPLDADSFIRKDGLMKTLPHFKNDENVAAVLPLMKVKKAKKLLEKIQWAEYMVNLFYKNLMSAIDCVQVAPGPFSVYKKEILKNIGGFDETNLTEDLEITLRLQEKQYKIIQTRETEVYTIVPNNLKSFYKQRNRWYKGTLLNAFSYKRMIFNKKYGDFGFIQMPRLLLEGVLVVGVLGLVLYTTFFRPLYYKIYNYAFINFQIKELFLNSIRNIKFLDLNFTNIFYGLAVMVLALFLLVLAHKFNYEKISKLSLVSIPAYLICYSFLASFVLIGVFLDLIKGKVQKW